MYKLGYTFDVGIGGATAALTGALTGKRVNLRNMQNLNFVALLTAAGTGTEDLVFKTQQFTASSSGTTANLVCDHAWVKANTTLDGTEQWVRVANAATDGTFTLAGATYAAKQCIVLFEVNTKDLTDGFDYASLSTTSTLTNTRNGTILALPADLTVRRSPDKLAPTLY